MNDAHDRNMPSAAAVVGSLDHLRSITFLHNHWDRRTSPRSYQWYLTFEDAPELATLAQTCQAAVVAAYYDPVPQDRLHMTIARVASIGELTDNDLANIEEAAATSCANTPSFETAIGALGGTAGALGFNASPTEPLRQLRRTLREATAAAAPATATPDTQFNPHVSIAYCNANDVPAAPVVTAVSSLHLLQPATVTVKDAKLVLLERQDRAYNWQTLFSVRLSNRGEHARN